LFSETKIERNCEIQADLGGIKQIKKRTVIPTLLFANLKQPTKEIDNLHAVII
jgi:hypothetical protein